MKNVHSSAGSTKKKKKNTARRNNVFSSTLLHKLLPRSCTVSFFFLKKVRLAAMYLWARVIPLAPVLPPHPAPSEPPTENPTLGVDVTGTATPLSTKPCANPAKQQIRHQKLSLWEHAAALSANEPANRWRHVSSLSLHAPPRFFPPLPSLLFFPPLLLLFICLGTSCLLYFQDRHIIAKPSVPKPLWCHVFPVPFQTVFPDAFELRMLGISCVSWPRCVKVHWSSKASTSNVDDELALTTQVCCNTANCLTSN